MKLLTAQERKENIFVYYDGIGVLIPQHVNIFSMTPVMVNHQNVNTLYYVYNGNGDCLPVCTFEKFLKVYGKEPILNAHPNESQLKRKRVKKSNSIQNFQQDDFQMQEPKLKKTKRLNKAEIFRLSSIIDSEVTLDEPIPVSPIIFSPLLNNKNEFNSSPLIDNFSPLIDFDDTDRSSKNFFETNEFLNSILDDLKNIDIEDQNEILDQEFFSESIIQKKSDYLDDLKNHDEKQLSKLNVINTTINLNNINSNGFDFMKKLKQKEETNPKKTKTSKRKLKYKKLKVKTKAFSRQNENTFNESDNVIYEINDLKNSQQVTRKENTLSDAKENTVSDAKENTVSDAIVYCHNSKNSLPYSLKNGKRKKHTINDIIYLETSQGVTPTSERVEELNNLWLLKKRPLYITKIIDSKKHILPVVRRDNYNRRFQDENGNTISLNSVISKNGDKYYCDGKEMIPKKGSKFTIKKGKL